jgi:hypothetical protein
MIDDREMPALWHRSDGARLPAGLAHQAYSFVEPKRSKS